MLTWDDLTPDQFAEVVDHGQLWYNEHEEHVNSMITGCLGAAYPPVGSDIFKPELWKSPHWFWFYMRYVR